MSFNATVPAATGAAEALAARTITTITTITDVAAGEWDDLRAGRPFTGWRWPRLAESVLVNHTPRYLLLRQGERLQATAVCTLHRRFEHRGLQAAAGWLVACLPTLRCGVPVVHVPGLLVRSNHDPEAETALLAGLRGLAARERCSLIKVEHLAPNDGVWPLLRGHGYLQVSGWTDTSLELPWPSFAAYLAALPARKRRAIRRITERSASEGITVETLDPAGAEAGTLDRLVGNVLARHGEPLCYRPQLLGRAAAVLGNDLTVLVARQAGAVVGCAALLRDGDHVTAKWLGLDYQRTWNTATYHRLVVECVAQAIALGARRLHTGATAFETKVHLGVEPHQRAAAATLPCRPLNLLAGLATGALARSVGGSAGAREVA